MRATASRLAGRLALAARSRWTRAVAGAALLHVAVAAPWWLTLSSAAPPVPPEAPLAVELDTLQTAAAAPPHERPIAVKPQQQTLARSAPPVPTKRPVPPPEHIDSTVPPLQQEQAQPQPPQRESQVADAAPAPSQTPDKAEKPSAPVLGQSSQPTLSPQQSWESKVLSQLERFKRYPTAARWQQQQDTVYLRLEITRDGSIKAASVLHSQGFQALDEEVIDMSHRAGQLPPPPPEVAGTMVALTIPVEFYIGTR